MVAFECFQGLISWKALHRAEAKVPMRHRCSITPDDVSYEMLGRSDRPCGVEQPEQQLFTFFIVDSSGSAFDCSGSQLVGIFVTARFKIAMCPNKEHRHRKCGVDHSCFVNPLARLASLPIGSSQRAGR